VPFFSNYVNETKTKMNVVNLAQNGVREREHFIDLLSIKFEVAGGVDSV